MEDYRDAGQCPWCDGRDKNFRPLRFGSVPCNNPWHSETATKANEPCKKHKHIPPCPYCKIDILEESDRVKTEALQACWNDFGYFGNGGVSDDTVQLVKSALEPPKC